MCYLVLIRIYPELRDAHPGERDREHHSRFESILSPTNSTRVSSKGLIKDTNTISLPPQR